MYAYTQDFKPMIFTFISMLNLSLLHTGISYEFYFTTLGVRNTTFLFFFHFERNLFISPFPGQVNGFGHWYKDSRNWLPASVVPGK